MIDLLNPSEPLFKGNRNGWNAYSDIIKYGDNLIDYKRENRLTSIKYAILIIRTFLNLVFHDIVYSNATFHFPVKNAIKLRIAKNTRSKKYNINTFGNTYIPWINFGWNFKKKTFGFYYYFLFGKTWEDKLVKEVENGHSYRDGLNMEHELPKINDHSLIDKAYEGVVTNIDKYI